MPNWTNDQKNAIESRGSNLLVSAAAGSGKTAVLVERIIRLITEDMIDINKLLIVTFTNAAAGEMRERILDALTKEIEKGSDKEEHLRRQISLLSRSYIMTLHAFCIDVVRKNFHLADIDPSFRIGDATERSIIIGEVLDELFEEEYEKGEDDFIKLVEGFCGNKEDTKLQELILRIYGFIQSKPYPEKWLQESVEMFNMSKEEFEKSPWIETIKESIRIEMGEAKDLINVALKLCDGINGPLEYKEALYDDLHNIESLLGSLERGLEQFYSHINDINHKNLKRISGNRRLEVDKGLQQEVQELRKKYKDNIKAVRERILTKSTDEYLEDINSMYPLMKYLFKMVVRFSEKYSEKKLEKGMLDFNDLEHYALKILENQGVQEEYRSRFRYIFVDEYQDSNIVQETILNRIKRDNNLFLVGDVKQSIYRFRLADPTLFIDKYETYKKDEKALNRRIDLSKNFRTREEILEAINFLFKNIMSKNLGEIDYNEEAYLYKGLEFEEIDNPHIELNIIDNNLDGIEDMDEELEEMSAVEVEARLVADRIKELIGKRTYNAKKGDYEEIQYKHMVVLLRTLKNWAPVFTEVFTKEGIPVYSDDSSGYFDTIEINMFLDLLRLIDNKRQDIPLLSVMRSPIGKFKTDELIKIRLNKREGSYYEALEDYVENMNDSLRDKLADFLNKLNKWTQEARTLKLDEFIWKLLIDTGYYHYVGAMPGGIQRQANLRILVDRASLFEKSAVNGLFLFLRFIDKLKKSKGGDMGTAKVLGENENVVRIMSVHKSKGLEFPVVIFAGLGKKFNLTDANEDVLLHKDLGLGPKYIDIDRRVYSRTLPQMAIRRRMLLENLSEEMRILYVALTRPVDRLILAGSVKDIGNESKKWARGPALYNLVKGRNYLDWICSSLCIHRDGEPLRNMAGISAHGQYYDDGEKSKWILNIWDRTMVLSEESQRLKTKRDERERLRNFRLEWEPKYKGIIEKRFNWRYAFNGAIKIPSKLSVTDIKRASAENIHNIMYKVPSLVKRPKFIEGKKPFTKAERGTIIHFVMQHLDFSRIQDEYQVKEQIDMMVAKELLTEEEAKAVNLEKILKFFKDPLGMRILSAHKVYRETPFVLRKKAKDIIDGLNDCHEEMLVQGIIDCYFEEDGDIILVDYKTDEVFNGNVDRVIRRYEVQLKLYREALENITGRSVRETYIYLFDIDKGVKLP